MRTGLTLHVGDLRRDVEINAARGTTVGQVHAALAAADPAGVPSPGAWWAGTRAVAPAARIGQPGLRHGCVVGVNRPGPGAGGDPSTVLRLHVVGGPDAGAVLPLPREGSVVIGRGPDCSLQLSDPEVSRHHAEVRMTPSGLRVRDLGSTNGSALETPGGSAGAVSGQAVALAVAQRFTVGESVLCVAGAAAPPAMVTTDDDGRLMVNRPPRVLFPLSDRTVELPVPASSSARAALPWLAAALPAVAGVAVAWYVGNAQFLAFALLSPVMMLGSALGERLTGRRGRRRARGEFRRLEAARRDEVQHLLQSEITARHSARPDAAETAHIAGTPSARIWERRRGDADFLQVRLGLGPQDASLVVRRGTATEPPVRLDAVPIAVDLREPLGICGPAPVTRSLARWLLCQLATLHSPGDVTVVAVLTDAAATGWEWLRWLPHCPEAAAVARRDDQRRALVGRLLVQLDQRVAGAPVGAGRTEPRRDWTGPWTLVLLDRTSELADVTGLGRLLRDGRSVGFTALCLEDDSRRLPPWCGTVARTSGELGSRLDLSHPRGPSDILADQVTVQWAERTARGLAPLVDPGTDASAAVPRIARLGDILGGVDLLPEDVLLRWRSGDGRATSVLGLGAEAPLAVDLDRDGPHVLVAGTTGAGKSELLQTLVVGLAVHASPVDLQFVLVDYKGGAAFADCARLPHTAGLVTDLDAQLTQRALRSLNAELRRREELFASARVTDLAAYRRTPSHRAASVGRLVLVVDEFAALAVELPDFVDGLVSIAQRGRSLGVHLVLATQRPAGVVSAEIRANTALRIALRVTDPAESLDIIGTDVAATIDPALPGRAYVRTGQGLVEMQALHLGAAREDSSEVRVVTLDAWGHPGQTAFTGERSTGPTDLCEVVQAVRSAAQSGGFGAARRPWLPPLPTVLDAATLSSWPPTGRIPLGLMDRPDEQAQRPLEIDLEEGTALLLTGGPRSGRTNAVRLLATTAVGRLPADRLHLYVIDGSGGGLRALQDTPHCGAVVPGRDGPLAARLLQRLSDEVAR
ncbi:MAG: FtsK/SpoIIIE domain-containing protein, partial [bacterium]